MIYFSYFYVCKLNNGKVSVGKNAESLMWSYYVTNPQTGNQFRRMSETNYDIVLFFGIQTDTNIMVQKL